LARQDTHTDNLHGSAAKAAMLTAIGVGLFAAATHAGKGRKVPPASKNLLFIGDSYTANYLSTSYADQLAEKLKANYKKVAKVGMNIKWMIDNASAEIAEGNYDMVFVLGGINDVYQGRSFENITANLKLLYDLAHKHGSKAVAITLPPTDYYNLYKPGIGDVVEKVNAWILNESPADYKFDFNKMLVDGTGKQDLKLFAKDKLHAVTAAHTELANTIAGKISLSGLGNSPDELGRPFDEARTKGRYTFQGNTYIRQEPLEGILRGKIAHASFTLGRDQEIRYCIIPASKLQPSHLGSVQNPLHFIPEAQPRNRSASKSGSQTPGLIASNLRPAEICEGASAYTGAPIVNTRGEVIQGNGRGATMRLYYDQFPEDPAGYKRYLIENEACFGFGENFAEHLAGIENPVLVRMCDVDDETAIVLGQYTQSDTEAVATEATKIKSKVYRVDDAGLRKIVDELLRHDSGESTLPELIRSSNVLQQFVAAGALRADELELYISNGVINKNGVFFVTSYLLNTLFKDGEVSTADVFTTLPDRIKQGIEKSTLYLLKTTPETSLNREISNAIMGSRDLEIFKQGGGGFKNWVTQPDIFGEVPLKKYSELELALIELWSKAATQKEITQPFKTYSFWVNDEPGDMFSGGRAGVDKNTAIEKTFGISVSKTDDIAEAEAEALLLQLELMKKKR
jgi:lysophospholipase L1-like esterase